MQTTWEHRYARRTQGMRSSAIRELLKLTENPDIISFAGGMPAPEIFPAEEFQEASMRVWPTSAPQAPIRHDRRIYSLTRTACPPFRAGMASRYPG